VLAPVPLIPEPLFGPDGRPRLGAWAGGAPPITWPAVGVGGRLRRLAREKRWVYLFAASPAVMLGAAVVEAGFFGGAFVWVLDRVRGVIVAERSAAGLPGRHARVGGGFGAASARFRGGGLALAIARDGARWTLRASAPGLEVDAGLDAAAPAPFTVVAPVPGAGPRLTTKAGALAASGAVRVGGAALSLDGGSGGVDATAGLLARDTDWRWAFGSGVDAAGRPVAFNLCAGFGIAPGDPGENALLAPGPHRLPPVAFAFDAARPLAPWRITSADGAVALVFRPVALHGEVKRLGIVSTRFAQVAGTFEGALPGPGPGGARLAIAGLPGVVEDHRARW
jgi:hypothetical protein